MTSIPKPPNTSNPYSNWKSYQPPEFAMTPISLPRDLPREVRDQCMAKYIKAVQLMEHSVGEVAMQYTHKDGNVAEAEAGPILQFAETVSNRYLDLLEAMVAVEQAKNIPMIPNTAGQLKAYGFTSQEIIAMKEPCRLFNAISDNIMIHFRGDLIAYNKFMTILTNRKLRDEFLKSNEGPEAQDNFFVKCIKEYEAIPGKELLDRVHLLMHDFSLKSFTNIGIVLHSISVMSERPANTDERLIAEVRHRIGGDATGPQRSYGNLGSNPLAYINLVRKGEYVSGANGRQTKRLNEAEFRERMYFIYRMSHVANQIIQDVDLMSNVNEWLSKHNKGWQIDNQFAAAVRSMGPSNLPPVFRYGSNAALSKYMRKVRKDHEKYYKENPNPMIRDVMTEQADANSYFNLSLSERELLNQTGEWRLDLKPRDRNFLNTMWKRLNYQSGGAYWEAIKDPSGITENIWAKEFLEKANSLQIPVVAGISGTLDQGMTMAGLVGVGLNLNEVQRKREQGILRLAYIAFMLPGNDHSIHEILQSSTTYGMRYVAGPGSQSYIFPEGGNDFLNKLELAQKKRGTHIPDYFLSAEYINLLRSRQAERAPEALMAGSPTELKSDRQGNEQFDRQGPKQEIDESPKPVLYQQKTQRGKEQPPEQNDNGSKPKALVEPGSKSENQPPKIR